MLSRKWRQQRDKKRRITEFVDVEAELENKHTKGAANKRDIIMKNKKVNNKNRLSWPPPPLH